jgi:hypothetical protein
MTVFVFVKIKRNKYSDGAKKCKCHEMKPSWTPLIEYLCQQFECSPKELQVVFTGLENRRKLIDHLQNGVVLKTTHIRPPFRNFTVRCGDLSTQSANLLPALGGYLNVTVCFSAPIQNHIPLGSSILLCQTWNKTALPILAMCDSIWRRPS